MKSARRLAREGLVQALYQWQLSANARADIRAQTLATERFARADQAFFDEVLGAVMDQAAQLDQALTPCLDREVRHLSPVEHAVLWIAAHELLHHPQTPLRVILNEAVELARLFGGTDGHKYVNGVLDRLSQSVRTQERSAQRA